MIPDVSFGALTRNNDGLAIVADRGGVVLRRIDVALAGGSDIRWIDGADGNPVHVARVHTRRAEEGGFGFPAQASGGDDAFTGPGFGFQRGADERFLGV